ncbi:hypothetical protein [Acinetobacter equi]|uniref:Uncharacterized protein n=1 Tax=Acinetobacter equi TaxID=1324350 RepID=A0A0N9VCZ1_9GAMM|nr:hypothetical protein [Acinetobacter equi]ALH94974.1 hypothetical protein AOY20_05165 [Acinetobacter equi]
MKYSKFLITILFSLFVFQSTWSTALVYCVHKSTTHGGIQSHFEYEYSGKNLQNPISLSSQFIKNLNQFDDQHGDHLLWSFYIAIQPIFIVFDQDTACMGCISEYIDDKNFYQSPYLNVLKPPPL